MLLMFIEFNRSLIKLTSRIWYVRLDSLKVVCKSVDVSLKMKINMHRDNSVLNNQLGYEVHKILLQEKRGYKH